MARWAEMLKAKGWASVVVDSHAPRGLTDHEVWRLVCAGQLLMGSERAGDVLVSLADARRMPFVDPDRMVLIGASHGGWAIMDLLALDPPRRLPFNLAAPPKGPADPLAGVVGTILLYPYCGEANRAGRDGWGRPIPALFLLSADDRVAPAGRCIAIAERLAAEGVPVETRLFEGVTHGFDQEERSEFSTLAFDPEATEAGAGGGCGLPRSGRRALSPPIARPRALLAGRRSPSSAPPAAAGAARHGRCPRPSPPRRGRCAG